MMPGKAFDWNVVVAGAWNVAIFTPQGIARRLFHLDPATPVEVQVPLDQQAPIRVAHGNVVVVPSETSLVIAPVKPTRGALGEASTIASRAIESLPETPMSAAGLNIRYRFDTIPDELLTVIGSSLDDLLAEGDFRTAGRSLKRAVHWEQGLLNVEILGPADSSGVVMFNFHRQSNEGSELRAWLGRSDAMIAATRKLLTSTLKLRIDEEDDE